MLKKTLLYSALLISNLAMAQIKLDFDLIINEQDFNRHITTELILDGEHTTLDYDDVIINLHVQETKKIDGICIQIDVSKKTELNTGNYIARPVLLAAWDKPAMVALGTKTNNVKQDTFKVVVKASQAQYK